jgi:transcriptional regulator with XRE-family HTH domain
MQNKSIGTFDELLSKLKGDEEFQKAYRKKKPYFDVLSEIIKRRKDLGITQVELAQKAGVPQSSVARLESGEHNINIKTLIMIAEALDTKLEIRLSPIVMPTPSKINIDLPQSGKTPKRRKRIVREARQKA